MESSQSTPSAVHTDIPQGIPTGVFVPNTIEPVSGPVVSPSEQVSIPSEPVVTPDQTPVSSSAAVSSPIADKPLDKWFVSLTRFLAKIFGQPDPITGAPNPAAKFLQKAESLSEKARGAANQVAEKAQNVADKTVTTVTHVTEKIQEVVPPPSSETSPSTLTTPTTVEQLEQTK